MDRVRSAIRQNRASLAYGALAYGTVLVGLAGVLLLQQVKETAAEPAGPKVALVLPRVVPLDVLERVEILGRETRFGPETRVTASLPGVLVSEVRFLDFDRLEVALTLVRGMAGGLLEPGAKVPLAVTSPLRDGGTEAVAAEVEVTGDHRPLTFELQSFRGLSTVEVSLPYVMIGYRHGGHGPWHLEVRNWTSDEVFTQETSAPVEHLGIPVGRGENLLELTLTDAAGRQARREVTVVHRPPSTSAQLIAFQSQSYNSYYGPPTQWVSPTYTPYNNVSNSQAKACSSCCAKNGPSSAAFGNSIAPPPSGEGGECEDGSDSEGCGPDGCDGQAHDMITGKGGNGAGRRSHGLLQRSPKGAGAGVAKGRDGGVVPESMQWRSELSSDVEVPGRGLDLEMTRRYHSDRATDGYFGKGWDFNWGARFDLDNPSTPAAGRYSRGDYRRDLFYDATYDYPACEYVFQSYGRNGSFSRVAVNTCQSVSKVVMPNGYTEEFDRYTGLVKTRKDRYGNAIAASYDYTGRLSFVTDAVGSTTSFFYYPTGDPAIPGGRISKVSGPGVLEATYEYGLYDSADPSSVVLTKVRRKAESWTNDVDPTNPATWTPLTGVSAGQDYTYYTDGRLKDVIDGRGVVALTNEYDASGKVTKQIHYGNTHEYEELTQVGWQGVRHWTPTQVNPEKGPPHTDHYLDPETGLPSRIRWNRDGSGPTRDMERIRPGCSSRCSAPTAQKAPRKLVQNNVKARATSLERDANGNVTRIRWHGTGQDASDTNPPAPPTPDSSDIVMDLEYGSTAYGFVVTKVVDPRAACTGQPAANYATTIAYDAMANPTRIDGPATGGQGNHYELRSYNAYGQLMTVGLHLGVETQYSYYTSGPGAGQVKDVKVRTSPTALLTKTFEYSLAGDVTKVRDYRGNETSYTVNSEHLVTSVLYPPEAPGLNRIEAKFQYNRNGELLVVEFDNRVSGQPQSNPAWTRRIAHTASNLVTSVEDEISEPLQGQPVFQKTSFAYDAELRVTQITDGAGRTSQFYYDISSLITKAEIGQGAGSQELLFEHDLGGNVTKHVKKGATPAEDVETLYEYDWFDRLTKVLDDVGGNSTAIAYDCASNPTSVVRAAAGGQTISEATFAYDEMGRRTQVVRKGEQPSLDDTTTLSYDEVGRVTAVTDTFGNQTTYAYDAAGRLTQVLYPLTAGETSQNSVTYTYDANDNLTDVGRVEVDTYSHLTRTHTWQYAYDDLDRLTSGTYHGTDGTGGLSSTSQVLAYDSRGLVLTKQDENGIKTLYTYDGLERLTQTTLNHQGSSPSPISMSIAYDLADNITSRTDGKGQTSTYAYDSQNRLTLVSLAGGNTKSYSYNKLGLPATYSDSKGAAVTYAYNTWGLVSGKTVSFQAGAYQTTSESYTYDAAHRFSTAQDDDSLVTFAYDKKGSLTQETLQILAGATRTTTYGYDRGSRLTSIGYPLGGTTVSYLHDELSRVKEVQRNGTPVARYWFEGPGYKLTRRERSLQLGGPYATFTTSYGYDALDRNTSVNHTKSTGSPTIRQVTYTWGAPPTGKIYERALSYIFDGTTTLTKTYGYDNAYRLTSAAKDGQGTTFNYDAAQSWSYISEPGGSTYYTVNQANQLTQQSGYRGSLSFTYDGSGNMLTKGSTRFYTYNYQDQLVSANETYYPPVSFNFRYDALGRRISEERTEGGTTTTHFFYAGSDIVVEADTAGNVLREAVFGVGIDRVEYMKVGTAHRFPVEDALGSVLAVVDENGTQKTSIDYGHFGETTVTGEAYPYAFTGRRYLPDLKLYDYRNRYYDAQLGRFIHRDPLGIWGDGVGLGNGYAYVGNDPGNRIDPFGLGFLDSLASFASSAADFAMRSAQVVGGVAEVAVGIGAAVATGGLGAVVGGLAVAHGVDNIIAGIRGENTFTQEVIKSGLEAAGVSEGVADAVSGFADGAIQAALTGGAGALTAAAKTTVKEGGEAVAREGAERLIKGGAGDATKEGAEEAAKKASQKKCKTGKSDEKPGDTTKPKENCFVAGTLVLTDDGHEAIEDITVGERVLTADSSEQDSSTQVDEATWRHVRLAMPNDNAPGDVFEIELLRPAGWVEATGCQPGGQVWLDLEEMAVAGWAQVSQVGPCPPIEQGAGRVVLGTITHLNGYVLQVRVEGQDAPIEPTGLHPFFSVSRNEWVKAGDLGVGEVLKTRCGSVRVEAIAAKAGVHRVYNLEVEGEHWYFVSEKHVLAHNNCPDDPARGEGKHNEPRSDLPRDGAGNYLPDPEATGAHSTLGTRIGQDGKPYPQGATFDENGNFVGRTDVTNHGRADHPNPHFHPATGPASVGPPQPIPDG
ncbi:MAG: hypothetical protein HY721_18145 [Planctomycetes bacterium]|nr:hypothetical protein [Planctomycetota bacterium]